MPAVPGTRRPAFICPNLRHCCCSCRRHYENQYRPRRWQQRPVSMRVARGSICPSFAGDISRRAPNHSIATDNSSRIIILAHLKTAKSITYESCSSTPFHVQWRKNRVVVRRCYVLSCILYNITQI